MDGISPPNFLSATVLLLDISRFWRLLEHILSGPDAPCAVKGERGDYTNSAMD